MKKILLVFGVLVLLVGVWYGTRKSNTMLEDYPLEDADVWWGKGKPKEDKTIHKFSIEVDEEVLQDLKTRLSKTRYFDGVVEGDDWGRGTPQPFMKELVAYWVTEFDWPDQVKKINQFEQFKTNINGLDIHFLHVKANRENKNVKSFIPIILMHGWPGAFTEFMEAIPFLTNPTDSEVAFDLVIPSLPGYGYSEATTKKGFNAPAITVIFAKLMSRLGYTQYIAQGGDYGSFFAKLLATYDPEHCIGVHLNMYVVSTPWLKAAYQLSVEYFFPNYVYNDHDRHKFFPNRLVEIWTESGYSHIQATRPYSVAQGLTDSPAGLAAYIIEKFHQWGDVRGDIYGTFTKDQLLTNVMIYWTTNNIASTLNYYYEMLGDHNFISHLATEETTAPTALADFYQDLVFAHPPLSWVGHVLKNIVQYTQHGKGGHFAAMEQPKIFSQDVLRFGKKIQELKSTK